MAARKLTQKEIKAPDEFQTQMVKVLEWLSIWGGWVLGGAALVLVVIVGAVLLTRHVESSRIDTAVAFDRAFGPLAKAELTRPPRPSTEADAVKKAADEVQAKAKAAETDLEAFVAKNADSPLGRLAVLGKAAAAYAAGDSEVARAGWQAFLTADPGASFAFAVWESYGNVSDREGKRDEAERAYTEMTKGTSALGRAFGYLHLGDLYNPATKLRADDPTDAGRAKGLYDSGLKEVGREEVLLSPAELVAKKTLQERLANL